MTPEEKKQKARELNRIAVKKYRSTHPQPAVSERQKAYRAQWQRENREKCRAYSKKYREQNPRVSEPRTDAQRKYQREWKARNPSKIRAYRQRWISKIGVKERLKAYERSKRSTDLNFRIASTLRCRIRAALNGIGKTSRTVGLLGCSIADFRIYLESRFDHGMTWENYGTFWEIDHIMPCAIFNLSNPDHQRRCFHFSNHQPLTVSANRKKHTQCNLPVF
jgi:hypothetical protein